MSAAVGVEAIEAAIALLRQSLPQRFSSAFTGFANSASWTRRELSNFTQNAKSKPHQVSGAYFAGSQLKNSFHHYCPYIQVNRFRCFYG